MVNNRYCKIATACPYLLRYRLAQVDFLAYYVGNGWVASAPCDTMLIVRVDKTLVQLDGGKRISLDAYEVAIGEEMTQV